MRRFAIILLTLIVLSGCNSSEYEGNLNAVMSDILAQSADAEDMIKIYSEIWSESINDDLSKEDIASIIGIDVYEVDNYFEQNRVAAITGDYIFDGDFESAINGTHNYFLEKNKIGDLEKKRDNIKKLMKSLNNPPKKYKEAYDITFETYSLYEKYIELAVSPSGSLVNYNSNANDLSSELVTKIKEFEVKMPE